MRHPARGAAGGRGGGPVETGADDGHIWGRSGGAEIDVDRRRFSAPLRRRVEGEAIDGRGRGPGAWLRLRGIMGTRAARRRRG